MHSVHWQRPTRATRPTMSHSSALQLFFGTKNPGPNGRGLSRKHIVEGLRASLARMKLDYVDLLFCHRPE